MHTVIRNGEGDYRIMFATTTLKRAIDKALAAFNKANSPPIKAIETYAREVFTRGFVAGVEYAKRSKR